MVDNSKRNSAVKVISFGTCSYGNILYCMEINWMGNYTWFA